MQLRESIGVVRAPEVDNERRNRAIFQARIDQERSRER